MRDIAILALFMPMLIPATRHVFIGTMLWVWTALASPTNYVFGFAAAIPFNKLAVAATVAAIFLEPGRRRPYIDAHMVVLLLFVAQGIVSFSFGLTDRPRGYDLLDKMTKIAALCVCMTTASRGRLETHAMAVVLCLSLGINGILDGLKFLATAGSYKVGDSPTLGDNNYIALADLLVMPMTLYLIHYTGHRLLRWLFIGVFVAVFLGVVATASRGGLIGLATMALILILQGRRKIAGTFLVGVLAVGLILLAPPQWTDRMQTIKTADDDSSFMSRVISWKMNTLVALDRPLLGGGYSALEDPVVHRAYVPMFHALDFIPTDEPSVIHAAHSIYFQALGDLGFTGLALLLGLFGVSFRNIGRIRRLTRADPASAWAYDLAATFRLTLIVFMVTGAALSAAYFEALYVILTMISVLRRLLEERAGVTVLPRVGNAVG